jgi:three-Cys-motif partner protein
MPPLTRFFDEQTEQSQVKTEIVRKYFSAWASVMLGAQKKWRKGMDPEIAYFDLFAGEGRYKDGAKSTPILILEEAIRNPKLTRSLITFFNEKQLSSYSKLCSEIAAVPMLSSLKYQPEVRNQEIDDDFADRLMQWNNRPPTLFFLDPWGYKGLSLKLIRTVLTGFGCDCIFFFNYSRVNAAISNPLMEKHIAAIFGNQRAQKLRNEVSVARNARQRQLLIIDALKEAIKQLGGDYCIEYFFLNDRGSRMSHFLILASKNRKAYDIMKDIMARESSSKSAGVPLLGFDPRDSFQPDLFQPNFIDDLAQELMIKFAGECLSVQAIFDQHNYGTRYVFQNYQEALKLLEQRGQIIGDPPIENRTKAGVVTCAKTVRFTFPSLR